MNSMDDLKGYLDFESEAAMREFEIEINTDENKDYRRGFRAGVLFSFLQMKSQIRNFNATTE